MLFDPSELVEAFDRDEVFPVFQPIVEMRTGQVAGFEVLARWSHSRLGLISPDEFIPVAERAGCMHRLTRTLLQKTFAARALVTNSFELSVNISSIQLLDPILPDLIAETAQTFDFPLHKLVIEVTESALVVDLPHAMTAANRLKELGCRLSLDDFGTGYSSLRHLHALPFDEIKIDRSFVSSMAAQRGSRKIVASVIGLGQSLGLTTVAEGVETQEQAEILLWMGCDLGQGWLFGRPAPAESFSDARALRAPVCPAPMRAPLSEGGLAAEGPPLHRLAQLQAIYDGAPVGLCLLDRHMRYVSLNRELADLNGAAAQMHLGRTPAEIVPLVFPQVEAYIRRALSGESVTGVEIHKPAGAAGRPAQTLLGFYHPVRDEAGEVIGVSVAIMDITQRKQMEIAVREMEEHYRTLIGLNPHVAWVLNPQGEVIEASTRWEAITGQPIHEAMGSGWLQMLHPQDVGPTMSAIRHSIEKGGTIDLSYRVRTHLGSWQWMHARGGPRFSASGEILGIYGVVEEDKKGVSPV